ncbi:MAG: 1,4-dihydroxy-2-naphthoate polyprenyltransferase, partial [Actinobacteria bacterium]
CAVGSLACALLVINNLRDIPTDREVGKKTLAVRLGDERTRWLFVALIVAAFVLCGIAALWRVEVLFAFVAVPLSVQPVRSVLSGAKGGALIPVLGQTGKLQLALGVGASVGLAIGG